MILDLYAGEMAVLVGSLTARRQQIPGEGALTGEDLDVTLGIIDDILDKAEAALVAEISRPSDEVPG